MPLMLFRHLDDSMVFSHLYDMLTGKCEMRYILSILVERLQCFMRQITTS